MDPAVLYLLLGRWWSRDLDLGLERLVDEAADWAGAPWWGAILVDILSDCIARD